MGDPIWGTGRLVLMGMLQMHWGHIGDFRLKGGKGNGRDT